jgi:hypothetical protein
MVDELNNKYSIREAKFDENRNLRIVNIYWYQNIWQLLEAIDDARAVVRWDELLINKELSLDNLEYVGYIWPDNKYMEVDGDQWLASLEIYNQSLSYQIRYYLNKGWKVLGAR